MARKRPRTQIVALALSWGAGDQPPTEFRVFQMGVNDSEKGQFLFDEEAAGSVLRQYAAHGKPLLFDYNHGTTYPEPTPEQAISAGEFVPEVRADGLWATGIKWTDAAADYIRNGEYRLFSPAFEHDTQSGRVLRLINIALTNLPALNHIAPLMAASLTANLNTNDGDEEMEEPKAQIAALMAQLTAKDTELSALKAELSTLKKDMPDMTCAVSLRADLRKLTGKDAEAEVLGVVAALRDSHTRLATLEQQLATEKTTRLTAEMNALLDEASDPKKSPKITPAERPGLIEAVNNMGLEKGVAWLKASLSTRVALSVGQVSTAKEQGQKLTSSASKVARLMGIPEEVWNGEKPPTAMNRTAAAR